MAATLLWIRDHYDNDHSRYIEEDEMLLARADWEADRITTDQYASVINAKNEHTLLPAYTGGCTPGESRCLDDHTRERCREDGHTWEISGYCLHDTHCEDGVCVKDTPPPPMETIIVSLSEGNHTIQVRSAGYETLDATINVTSTGVICVSGPCGTSGLPRVETSGYVVTAYLKGSTGGYAAWVASKGGSGNIRGSLPAVGEIIDGYLSSVGDIGYLGFDVSLANIGTTIDYYLG